MSECCLNLLVPQAYQERLLDALLMTAQARLVCSGPAAVHGLPHHRMTSKEQVLGRVELTHVQVLLALADRDLLLAKLGRECAGQGLRYWITPVLAQGEFA